MAEISTRQIKGIVGNGTGSLIINPTRGKRLHTIQAQLTYAGGTNTLLALSNVLTEIRVKVGTNVRIRLTGRTLRDWLLLHGSTYDWNGLPNGGAQVTIPFAPEWFLDNVADALAWNPALLGGDISVEIDSSASLTAVVFERTSDDLGAPSAGILTYEIIKPVAGGQAFYVEQELEPKGRLVALTIYPDTGGQIITPASLMVGPNDLYIHEGLSRAQNIEQLERYGLTPADTARGGGADYTKMYDMVFVKADALSRAINLEAWGRAKLKIEAGSSMTGSCDIMVCRLEAR